MSDYKPLPDFFMCSPDYYDVNYTINPWMSILNSPNRNLARSQWLALYQLLESFNAKVEVVTPVNCPDLVFIADAGIIHNNTFVISNFKFNQRRAETPFWKSYFSDRFDLVEIDNNETYEGSGDSFISGDSLFCGYGFRTTAKAASYFCEKINLQPKLIELIDERFYHLDTCFSPLKNNNALIYPKAFSKKGLSDLENNFDCYEILEEEALNFACNIVSFNNNIIINSGSTNTISTLERFDYLVNEVDLSEFIKAGGSAKCLTLKLNQRI